MEPLTLYIDSFWISPYALSSFVALEEKRLPYTVKEISLPDQQQRSPGYPARTSRVPALQHGDFWLAESMAIAEYLAETFPFPKHPRLYPADLRERGICREIMSWLRSDLVPIREERSTHTIWYERTKTPLSPAGQAAKQKLVAACEPLIQPGQTTLFDAWCIGDLDLSMMLMRLVLNGDEVPDKLATYAHANWSRPSVRKWNEHLRRPYVPY
jgi:glutathione S-transferase